MYIYDPSARPQPDLIIVICFLMRIYVNMSWHPGGAQNVQGLQNSSQNLLLTLEWECQSSELEKITPKYQNAAFILENKSWLTDDSCFKKLAPHPG